MIGKAGIWVKIEQRIAKAKRVKRVSFLWTFYCLVFGILGIVSSSKEGMKGLLKQPRNYSPFSVGWGLLFSVWVGGYMDCQQENWQNDRQDEECS